MKKQTIKKKVIKSKKVIKKKQSDSDYYVIETKIPLKILFSLTFILLTVFQGKNTFENIKKYIEGIKGSDPTQKLTLLLIVKGIYKKKNIFDHFQFSLGLLNLYVLVKELYTIVIKHRALDNSFLKSKIKQKATSILIDSAIDHFFNLFKNKK